MKIKTSDLTGTALGWAVDQIERGGSRYNPFPYSRNLPDLPLPPGYRWTYFSARDTPGVERIDPEDAFWRAGVVYYEPLTQRIRRRHGAGDFTTAQTNLSREEALRVMAQMAWMGEI